VKGLVKVWFLVLTLTLIGMMALTGCNSLLSNQPPNSSAKVSTITLNHTGYVATTMQSYGSGYSSITFQDGFALTFVAQYGGYSAPAIREKVKVTYYYDSGYGGNVITGCQSVK
jgi:hypothetical protein